MSTGLIIASIVGRALAEALASGVNIQQVRAAADETGIVPPGAWDRVNDGIADQAERWRKQRENDAEKNDV